MRVIFLGKYTIKQDMSNNSAQFVTQMEIPLLSKKINARWYVQSYLDTSTTKIRSNYSYKLEIIE